VSSARLQKEIIWSGLSSKVRSQLVEFDVFSEIDSTNRWASQMMADHGCGGVLCLSEKQTAGRGRYGKSWYSPFGENIYFSWGCEIEKPIEELSTLSLVVGVHLAKAFEKIGVSNITLKWPNDLFLNEKKIAGVLIEVIGSPALTKTSGKLNTVQVVIGVGININMRSDSENIAKPWCSLLSEIEANGWEQRFENYMIEHDGRKKICRNKLAKVLITDIIEGVMNFAEVGFDFYKAIWSRFDCLKNRRVVFCENQNRIVGVGRGISASGEYLVDVDGQIKTLKYGELSVALN